MFVPLKLIRTMPGHLPDDGIRDAFNKQHRGGEMAKIVNPQIRYPG
ncbi:MAG: hypothetical protein M3209_17670 [Acidobacteriota bacterium]|nr:hypothetical protein [Acidobacteriota bacterium]